MERLQGPIHPYFLEEQFGMVECLEEQMAFLKPSFEEKTPFLQMLQNTETTTPFLTLKDPNFQTLLKLQHFRYPWEEDIIVNPYMSEIETQVQCTDFESCITLKSENPPSHEVVITSKSNQDQDQDQDQNLDLISGENCCSREGNSSSSTNPQTKPSNTNSNRFDKPIVKERKKRKRTKASKNKEEVETQRMTHIAVERNRRRLMNDHLNSLRSLMPPSYIQRGDQASIIGGAIDFVKELEQLLQSLEGQKRMRKPNTENSGLLFSSLPEYKADEGTNGNCAEQVKAEHKSSTAEIEVMVIQNHVNLKIQCSRRNGLLLKAISSLEDLRLTVLHLSITSFQEFVLYSFNLKMEDGCKVGSADEIAATVDRIFK